MIRCLNRRTCVGVAHLSAARPSSSSFLLFPIVMETNAADVPPRLMFSRRHTHHAPSFMFSSSRTLLATNNNNNKSTQMVVTPMQQHQQQQQRAAINDHRQFSSVEQKMNARLEQSANNALRKLKALYRDVKGFRGGAAAGSSGNNNRNHKQQQNEKNNRGGNNKGRQYQRNMFEWRRAFASDATRLSARHFHHFSLDDLVLLLNLASALSPASGTTHVADGVTNVLLKKLPSENMERATDVVVRLLKLRKREDYHQHHRQTDRRRGAGVGAGSEIVTMKDRSLVRILDHIMLRLAEHFAQATVTTLENNKQRENVTAATATPAPQKGKDHSSSSSSSSDRSRNAVATYDDELFRRRVILSLLLLSNDTRLDHLFTEPYLRQLVVEVLRNMIASSSSSSSAAAFEDVNNNKSSSMSSTTATVSSKNDDHDPQHQQHNRSAIIAVLATSVCRLRIFNAGVVEFFKWAAPICIEEVDSLSPAQIGYIMEAFSCVGYHHPGLFITLGQKAGELGELLRDDEVARVINALSRTKIEHSKLRSSLESSMRMKTIHRKQSHTTTVF